MTRAPALTTFDPELPVEMLPDASSYAIGVVVLQGDASNRDRVLTYKSRRLPMAQQRYATTER